MSKPKKSEEEEEEDDDDDISAANVFCNLFLRFYLYIL
jgi:hypothetical protein